MKHLRGFEWDVEISCYRQPKNKIDVKHFFASYARNLCVFRKWFLMIYLRVVGSLKSSTEFALELSHFWKTFELIYFCVFLGKFVFLKTFK